MILIALNTAFKIGFTIVFSPRQRKSNGLVNQIFTRPFSLVVQKVVQNNSPIYAA